ncbi:MAG: S-adenosylmethionine:tRNA ribosyltransferase-isomerase [Bacteroidota bacterium]
METRTGIEEKDHIQRKELTLHASYIEKRTDHFIIELAWSPGDTSFAALLHHAGAIPLPPYLKRSADKSDTERYQTIYAHHDGSCSSPNSRPSFYGCHLKNLQKKNIQTDFVTLHVGAGTFKPVKSETMEEHEMHAEFIDVSVNTIENILRHPRRYNRCRYYFITNYREFILAGG